MSVGTYPVQASEPYVVEYHGIFVGGTTDLDTAAGGDNMTPAHAGSTGKYTITLSDYEGLTFLGMSCNLAATTAVNVAGHTVVRESYSAGVLTFWLYNASFAAHDLAALEWFDITLRFKRTGV